MQITTKNLTMRLCTDDEIIVDVKLSDDESKSIAAIINGEVLMVWDAKLWKFDGLAAAVPKSPTLSQVAEIIYDLASREKWGRNSTLAWVKNGGTERHLRGLDAKIIKALTP